MPSITKRSAFMVWRCGRAFSPGSRICSAVVRLVVVLPPPPRASGSVKVSTRRSIAAGVATFIASSTSGRTCFQLQWVGAGPPSRTLCAAWFSHSGARFAAFQSLRISS